MSSAKISEFGSFDPWRVRLVLYKDGKTHLLIYGKDNVQDMAKHLNSYGIDILEGEIPKEIKNYIETHTGKRIINPKGD